MNNVVEHTIKTSLQIHTNFLTFFKVPFKEFEMYSHEIKNAFFNIFVIDQELSQTKLRSFERRFREEKPIKNSLKGESPQKIVV